MPLTVVDIPSSPAIGDTPVIAPPTTPAPTPGWMTTEFWVTLASNVFAALVLLKIVTPTDAANLTTAIGNAIPAVIAIISSAAVIIKYIQSRVATKVATTNAAIEVQKYHLQLCAQAQERIMARQAAAHASTHCCGETKSPAA